jgi:hypothetical protein
VCKMRYNRTVTTLQDALRGQYAIHPTEGRLGRVVDILLVANAYRAQIRFIDLFNRHCYWSVEYDYGYIQSKPLVTLMLEILGDPGKVMDSKLFKLVARNWHAYS